MLYAILAALIFVLDFLIKEWVENDNGCGEERKIKDLGIIIKKYHNKGAFLNLGESKSGLVAEVSVVMTLLLTVLFLVTFTFKGSRLLKTGLALLLGGAYSNTYDRMRRQYVVDYMSLPVKNRFIRNIVFNISDFCIILGSLFVVLGSV